ncbi:hypothetical protein EON65_01240 [archaeon]|nr:MAG: hypothetical protein EON65_01240 [archaeon]
MSQYLSAEQNENSIPTLLRPLPDGLSIIEIWCGSEFTLVADEYGRVWGCGWSEHSNVKPVHSIPKGQTCVNIWHLVHDQGDAGVELAFIGDGALAAGGGHVVCFRK